MPRRASSVASRFAVAASLDRRMRPQMSSSHWVESAPKKKFVVVSCVRSDGIPNAATGLRLRATLKL